MPVTKKKGAIFAIYADTPPRAGPSSAPAVTSQESSERIERSDRSSRRALTPIEPAPTKPRGFPSARAKADKADEQGPSNPRRAVSSVPVASSSSNRSRTRSHIEVFEDSAPKRSSTTEPSKPLSAPQPKSSKPLSALQPKPLSSSSTTEEKGKGKVATKALGAKVKRARSPTDKENAAPDSPASRTRSKARLLAENANTNTTTSLTLKDKLVAAKKAAPAKKTQTRKPFAVFADSPLADVSEAYGARGEEPEGFRDQAKRTSRALRS